MGRYTDPFAGRFIEDLSPHLVVGLEGPSLNDGERDILSRFAPSGVIIFDRNVVSAGQLADLTADIS